MEEINRTHKEPAWGWYAELVSDVRAKLRERSAKAASPAPRRVVTPWSPRSTPGWSA